MHKKNMQRWIPVIVMIVVLCLFVQFFKDVKGFLYGFSSVNASWDSTYSLAKLMWQHLSILFFAGSISVLLGVGFGIFSLTAIGRPLKIVLEKLACLGEMIPSLALLSFMLPVFGYGIKPAIIALVIFGVMPILLSTITGLQNVPDDIIEVATSLGMQNRKILKQIKIPLALPVIISGLRTSLIICVSSATLASLVGGGGLGILLFLGMKNGSTISMIEGTVPICLLALIIDKSLKNIETIFKAKSI
jgi:osmoprotectant transport system permease protein